MPHIATASKSNRAGPGYLYTFRYFMRPDRDPEAAAGILDPDNLLS